MSSIYHFIMAWKDLITKVFGEYPLAGALVTLIAVGLFYQLEKNWRPRKRPSNLLLTLIGWAIVVPILGFVLNIAGEAWEIIKGLVPALAKLSASLYAIYTHHPYVVLAVVAVAILTYFAWKRWRPRLLPYRAARVIALVIAAILVTLILGPIADSLGPPKEADAHPAAQPTPPANAETQPPQQPADKTPSTSPSTPTPSKR